MTIHNTEQPMNIQQATALVTGANRGIGLVFAKALLERGARKVYAAARNPERINLPGVVPLKLDVTSAQDVLAAAELASDVNLVVNNAGIASFGSFTSPDAEAALRRHLETNVFGVLRVSQAFAPILARNGGGAFLNVASIASWVSRPALGNYAVSKAALWSLSNALRNDFREQGTQVLTLHMGFVDTDMTTGIDAPKISAESVVTQALDALEAGKSEVLADELTRQVKSALSAEPAIYLQAR
jgi:NAD(P)-dependent dehydrogenase (short-subunit alcohol dehydrogenase family)